MDSSSQRLFYWRGVCVKWAEMLPIYSYLKAEMFFVDMFVCVGVLSSSKICTFLFLILI